MEFGKGIIRLWDVLEQMDSSNEPFDITYITADLKKGTGGEIKERRNCRLTGTGRKGQRKASNTKVVPVPTGKSSRNPNHFENATRNIILQNGQTRTFHIFLLQIYNGKKVII